LVQLGVASCIGVGIAGAADPGLLFPGVLQREPRLAAGPMALAASDLLTLLLYFNLARWLLA
jgi:magnesium transporter